MVATHSGSGVEGDPDGLALVAADELRRRYESDLIIEPARVFAVDSVSGRSGAEVTALKRAIASAKQAVCQVRRLNSTENYGRGCLTPLSPHRNYILS